MEFTEKLFNEIKEELNKQAQLIFNEYSKTRPHINLDKVEDEDVLADRAAEFTFKKEDIKDSNDLSIASTSLNSTFLIQKVIPEVDKTILENVPEEVIKGLYSIYLTPKYYSEVIDELNFDNNVMNTILVPENRLPENKNYVEVSLNRIFNVDISYKVFQLDEEDEWIHICFRIKIGKGVIKND